MHIEFTRLNKEDGSEIIEIYSSGTFAPLVKIIHKFKVRQVKKYLKFKAKNNLK